MTTAEETWAEIDRRITRDPMMNANAEKSRANDLIYEYQKRIRTLRDRIDHIDFMIAKKAADQIQPRVEGFNDWAADAKR
jgi:hypothetical protein